MGFNTTYATCYFESAAEAQNALGAFEGLDKDKSEKLLEVFKNQGDNSVEIIKQFDGYSLEKIEQDNDSVFLEIDFDKNKEVNYVINYLNAVASAFLYTSIFSMTFDDNEGSDHFHMANKDGVKHIYSTGFGNAIDQCIYDIKYKDKKEQLGKMIEMYNDNVFSEEKLAQANQDLEKKQKKEMSDFNIGDKVEHFKFGKGVIVDIGQEGTPYYRVEVDFENDEKKWLVISYAKLKRI